MSNQPPSVGRVVNFHAVNGTLPEGVLNVIAIPAVITRVYSDGEFCRGLPVAASDAVVDLQLFFSSLTQAYQHQPMRVGVALAQVKDEPDRWSWLEHETYRTQIVREIPPAKDVDVAIEAIRTRLTDLEDVCTVAAERNSLAQTQLHERLAAVEVIETRVAKLEADLGVPVGRVPTDAELEAISRLSEAGVILDDGKPIAAQIRDRIETDAEREERVDGPDDED